jgi:hypothetical protein
MENIKLFITTADVLTILVELRFNFNTYRNMIILPVLLYAYETWSLTLSEEHRLKVFENRVLRKIFGQKRDEVIGWRKLHSEELHNLYSSPNIIRMIKSKMVRCAVHVA